MKSTLFFLILVSCANLTVPGSQVRFIESSEPLVEQQALADKIVHENDCRFVGFVDAKTSKFPGSYSLSENEIHAALRNRAAKIGANLVIANFYKKPAQGIGLFCSEEFLKTHTL